MSDIRSFFATTDSHAKRRAVAQAETNKKSKPCDLSVQKENDDGMSNGKSEPTDSRLGVLLTEPTWKSVLAPEFTKSYFKQLEAFLHREDMYVHCIYIL